jgi:acyl-CoA synthetase (AMP-forming)/AMP-acid ligase II
MYTHCLACCNTDVWARSGTIAHKLRNKWGCERGDRVILCYSFGLHFFEAFLACLRAGVVAVPVYPPNPATVRKSLAKLQAVSTYSMLIMNFYCDQSEMMNELIWQRLLLP